MASSWGVSWGTSWANTWGVGTPVEPTVILYGGDDAPRRKRRKRKTEEFYHDICKTVHELISHTGTVETADIQPSIHVEPPDRQLEKLLVLAKKSHESLRALGEIKRQVDAIAQERYAQELEDEEFVMLM